MAVAPIASEPVPVVRVEPSGRFRWPDLHELWAYRELALLLMWRDVKLRYKQTALGALWAVLQPVLTVLIFTLVFGRFGHIPSQGVPYSVFALCGMVPWLFFANGLLQGGNALVTNAQLVTKVYFPRILIPFATLLAGAVDFAIGLVVLIGAMIVAGIAPGPEAVLAIPLLGLGFLVALGLAVGLSALNVRYRDVRHAIPFMVQLWFFATPVVYPVTILGEPWRTIAALNPMTGVVEGFRWALLGAGDPGGLIGISIASGVAMTALGLAYFARVERSFADVV